MKWCWASAPHGFVLIPDTSWKAPCHWLWKTRGRWPGRSGSRSPGQSWSGWTKLGRRHRPRTPCSSCSSGCCSVENNTVSTAWTDPTLWQRLRCDASLVFLRGGVSAHYRHHSTSGGPWVASYLVHLQLIHLIVTMSLWLENTRVNHTNTLHHLHQNDTLETLETCLINWRTGHVRVTLSLRLPSGPWRRRLKMLPETWLDKNSDNGSNATKLMLNEDDGESSHIYSKMYSSK